MGRLEVQLRARRPREVAFLDRLCIDGNDIEVQLAMEKLQDEDLFLPKL